MLKKAKHTHWLNSEVPNSTNYERYVSYYFSAPAVQLLLSCSKSFVCYDMVLLLFKVATRLAEFRELVKEVVRSACRTALLEVGFVPDEHYVEADSQYDG